MTGWLLSLATLSFVMSVTPGPNNILFAASGSRVGFTRSLPILAGMLGGFALVIVACRAGIGALVDESRAAETALTVMAAAYLGWLGVRLWRASGDLPDAADGSPVSWWSMATLQGLNPKTWLASLAFASGFLGANSPGGHYADLIGVTVFLLVVTFSASIWTLFGAAVRERLRPPWQVRWNRFLSLLSLATAAGLVAGVGA